MIQHTTLVAMDAITLIVIREWTMTMKECQSFAESLLADGYKPVDDFAPITNEAAERYLDCLYDEYNHVQCVHMPRFSECGVYVFMCE